MPINSETKDGSILISCNMDNNLFFIISDFIIFWHKIKNKPPVLRMPNYPENLFYLFNKNIFWRCFYINSPSFFNGKCFIVKSPAG